MKNLSKITLLAFTAALKAGQPAGALVPNIGAA